MLKLNELVEKIGIEYEEMLKQVNIMDFYKTIALFSSLGINEISDSAVLYYLEKWCKNKKKMFDFMGKKVRVDFDFNYKDEKNKKDKFIELMNEKENITYSLWLNKFKYYEKNKIDFNIYIEECNCFRDFIGMKITSFFERVLKAPEKLVTDIGKIFENKEIEAKFTISIEPVDMMLASENPYNWKSCYEIKNISDGNHSDGCLGSILDSSSVITYVWNNEGKLKIGNYEFKNIRYKRMRNWTYINKDFNCFYFCDIYPGKNQYSNTFYMNYREMIENFLSKDSIWERTYKSDIKVEGKFGYNGEFEDDSFWKIKDSKESVIYVYDEEIICPCGCKNYLNGNREESDEYTFEGNGFVCYNFNEKYNYCEYTGDYEECDGNCKYCHIYNRENNKCELTGEFCEDYENAEYNGEFEPFENNIVHCNPERCLECPYFAEHYKREEEEE